MSRSTVTAFRRQPPSSAPVLVACSHGTRSTAGRRAGWALRHEVEARRPALDVRPAFVDVQSPELEAVVASATGEGRPVVVVPLLLSGGYHVHVDVARAVARAGGPAVAAEPLGPDDALVDVLRTRMTQARVRPGDGVVLAAAGSSDARAVEAVEEVAHRLSRSLSMPVPVGYLSAARPRLADVVAATRAQGAGRVAVATYLLAPGMFAEWAAGAGADVVTDPLLRGDGTADPALAELVLRRYDTAAAQLRPDATR